jgi:hypothetical protein
MKMKVGTHRSAIAVPIVTMIMPATCCAPVGRAQQCPTTTRIDRADRPGVGQAVQPGLHHCNILWLFSAVVDSRSEQRPVALPVSGGVSEANQWHLRITPNMASSCNYTKS